MRRNQIALSILAVLLVLLGFYRVNDKLDRSESKLIELQQMIHKQQLSSARETTRDTQQLSEELAPPVHVPHSSRVKPVYFRRPVDAKLGSDKQMHAHAQSGQDWLVASLLGCKFNGFFLDLASHDAMRESNTLMLERDFGWNSGKACALTPMNIKFLNGLIQRECSVVSAAVATPSDQIVEFATGPGDGRALGGIVGDEFDNKKPGPKGTIKKPGPKGTIKKPGPKGTIKRPGPKGTIKKPGPKGTIKNSGPKGTIKNQTPQTSFSVTASYSPSILPNQVMASIAYCTVDYFAVTIRHRRKRYSREKRVRARNQYVKANGPALVYDISDVSQVSCSAALAGNQMGFHFVALPGIHFIPLIITRTSSWCYQHHLFNTQESMQIVIGHSMIAAKVCHSCVDTMMLEMVYD